MMMSKIVNKLHNPHVLRTTPAQHKKKKENLKRVPVWYRPNTL